MTFHSEFQDPTTTGRDDGLSHDEQRMDTLYNRSIKGRFDLAGVPHLQGLQP
jgi:hypothetical protein